MVSDEHLMMDFQRGSREAFTELFERYREPVYGFFRRRIQNVALAEELTQETFLGVLRGAEKYEPRATFRTYLYSIAFRQISGEWRRAKREMVAAECEPASATEPGDVIWLRRAVEKLNPAHREVLLMREYEELNYEEIAAVLNVPLNTVRSRLFRARRELRSLLSPEGLVQREHGREGSKS